jgi:hypothetical protein
MKPSIELIRLETRRRYGTFGVLRINKQVFCATLEPASLDNARGLAIPAGQYDCHRVDAPTWGDTFQVLGVPGRTGILFHSGNTADDTRGCILLAQHYGKLCGARAVLNSGKTFKTFMGLMRDVGLFTLTIKEVF